MSDRFPFMRMYRDMARHLSKKDQADFYNILIDYALDDKEPKAEGVGYAVFEAARRVIDKWKQTSAAGRKRAENAGRSVEGRWKVAGNEKPAKEEKNKSIKEEKNKRYTHTTEAVVRAYNDTCISLPKVVKITDTRKRHILARIKEHSEDELKRAFIIAEQSDFLSGRKTDWHADFDWLMKEGNLIKVLEGNYNNTNKKKSGYQKDWDDIGAGSDPEELEKTRRVLQ